MTWLLHPKGILPRFPTKPDQLRNKVLKLPLLTAQLIRHAHCPECDEHLEKSLHCPRCARQDPPRHVSGYEGDTFDGTALAATFEVPLAIQLECRLKGMYLQHIVDTNDQILRDVHEWDDSLHSGDTLDCEKTRMLFRKHSPVQDLGYTDPITGARTLKTILLFTTSSDVHSAYLTFDFGFWALFMKVHNQPPAWRSRVGRYFLLKGSSR